ncbi:MAG: endonuclease [Bacteroidaceae bacterium]|nr:endonuclease [Bacteroidaceae bacterium]
MNKIRRFFIAVLSATVIVNMAYATGGVTRKQLAEYASSLKGLKKAELKEAMYRLMTPKTVLEYGSGSGHTWDGFYDTDRTADNYCVDRYCDDRREFGSRGAVVSGLNIEHSFPKSWWGGTKNSAYMDLFNLMPSEVTINSAKSNYGMGVVDNIKDTNGCTKVGTGKGSSSNVNLWEPADKWKGDFSRSYMYMATAHQNLNTKYTGEALTSLEKNVWPTLQQWAYTLYLKWTRTDKVDQIEIDRNNAVYEIQGNRNLFVDYPTLAEYVWGDSIDAEFDPYTALTTCSDDDRYASYQYNDNGGSAGGNSGNESGGNGGDSNDDDNIDDVETGEVEGTYILVTNVGDLKTGDNLLIASDNYVMSSTQAANNRPAVTTTVTDNKIVYADDMAVVTLVRTGDYWLLKTNGGYLYAASSSSNWLRTSDKADNTTKASITQAADGCAVIKFVNVSGRNELRYNTSANVFSCYMSGNQKAVQLYRRVATTDGVSATTISTDDEAVYNLNGVKVDASYKGIVVKNGKKYFNR